MQVNVVTITSMDIGNYIVEKSTLNFFSDEIFENEFISFEVKNVKKES